jgi:hypothetical protein
MDNLKKSTFRDNIKIFFESFAVQTSSVLLSVQKNVDTAIHL